MAASLRNPRLVRFATCRLGGVLAEAVFSKPHARIVDTGRFWDEPGPMRFPQGCRQKE